MSQNNVIDFETEKLKKLNTVHRLIFELSKDNIKATYVKALNVEGQIELKKS